MSSEVRVVLQSLNSATGNVLTSIQLRYWRSIHSELMTHKFFSRSAGSSRAIPVKKTLAQVWNEPAGPSYWGENQAGMQAAGELQGWKLAAAKWLWRTAGKVMCGFAWAMMKLNLHKQVANRLLEPWQYINVLVSSTEWEGFYKLRCHPDAQPEFQELACKMRDAIQAAEPQPLKEGQWHLPYVLPEEYEAHSIDVLRKLSTARCARISYAPFDGDASVQKELKRHDLLVGSDPKHVSPAEHQAQAMKKSTRIANFYGFMQYRYILEQAEK